jgi:hypothetical protein
MPTKTPARLGQGNRAGRGEQRASYSTPAILQRSSWLHGSEYAGNRNRRPPGGAMAQSAIKTPLAAGQLQAGLIPLSMPRAAAKR